MGCEVVSWQEAATRLGGDGIDGVRYWLPGTPDSSLQEPREGNLGPDTAAALVQTLSTATTTPDDVFVAVWDGWGDQPPE